MRDLLLAEFSMVSGASGCPIQHYDAGKGNGQTYFINPNTGEKVMDPIPGSPGYSSSADYPAVNRAYCSTGSYSNGGHDSNGYIRGGVSAGIQAGGAIMNGVIWAAATGGL